MADRPFQTDVTVTLWQSIKCSVLRVAPCSLWWSCGPFCGPAWHASGTLAVRLATSKTPVNQPLARLYAWFRPSTRASSLKSLPSLLSFSTIRSRGPLSAIAIGHKPTKCYGYTLRLHLRSPVVPGHDLRLTSSNFDKLRPNPPAFTRVNPLIHWDLPPTKRN
jgi:hypothetical protein